MSRTRNLCSLSPKSLWIGWRFGFGRAVGAGVRCAIVDVGSAVTKHGLAATHGGGVLLTNTVDMAHRGELLESLWRHAGLDEDVTAYFVTDGEAGFFNGNLNVHVVLRGRGRRREGHHRPDYR